MKTEGEYLEEILNGTFTFRRFTRKEQIGSSDPADRFLWLAILRAELELAGKGCAGLCAGAPAAAGTTAPPCRFLTTLSDVLPDSFGKLASDLGRFRDRGRESIVFDAGDGFVYKLRRMVPSILSGYMAPLAAIVYHNAIFPRDRYTLETIYCDGTRYFMVLKQPLVEMALDADGYPVRPTGMQVHNAITELDIGLKMYSHGECSDDDVDDVGDSGSSDSEAESAEHLKFYNGDYYISDLQPGRNTVIDSSSGAVRFIDPRITLNDPNGPITPVSHLGMRREEVAPLVF